MSNLKKRSSAGTRQADGATTSRRSPRPGPLVCLSHLRWDFVFQRPQHLLVRWARERPVFFFEEPVIKEGPPHLDVSDRDSGVTVAVPHLPPHLDREACIAAQKLLLDDLLSRAEGVDRVLWYYTPMALSFSRHVKASAVVYDCMDELSGFLGAPRELKELEAELCARADVMFTGGHSLYEAKRRSHPNVHPFPSSVDVPHFAKARSLRNDPADQAHIPQPRLGFFGVIDERMDIELVRKVAEGRPDWHIVLLGPVVKIDPASLPRLPNIHYLGQKRYDDLPAYLAGWDIAILPFARNSATRYISPTKTPEYMAGGKPVISTSIRDVVRPYGEQGLVRIADTPVDFIAAAEAIMAEDRAARQAAADAFLMELSWDKTWARMKQHVDAVVQTSQKRPLSAKRSSRGLQRGHDPFVAIG